MGYNETTLTTGSAGTRKGVICRVNQKNTQGAGTIRKRADGRWEARFTTGFDPASGKQIQKSVYGRTQKEVREKLAQITVELNDGTYTEKNLSQKSVKNIHGVLHRALPKTGRSRVITAAPSVMALLRKQKSQQAQMRLLAGQDWENPWDLVFTKEDGGHLSHFMVYKTFKEIVTGMGLDYARFHDLRHSYAVVSIESGDDIKTVQMNLGHATASFTLDVYGHVSQKMRRQSADRTEQFIKKVSG